MTEIRSSPHILLAVTGSRPGREMELEGVTAGVPQRPYDVLPALAPLPGGGLVKGSVVAAGRAGALCVAPLAGPSQAGMWYGVAGMPDLGILGAYWRSNAAQTPAARGHADAIPAPARHLRAGAS